MTDSQFTIDKRLKDARLSDITQGFIFETGLGNIIKWYLIGLYITNDKVEIEQLENLFTKNGSLYDKRAYKSEAKAVYKALITEEIAIYDDNGKRLTMADIANLHANDIPHSVGVLYKGIPKEKAEESPDKAFKQAVKQAIESPNIDTGNMTAKQLYDQAKGISGSEEITKIFLEKVEQGKRELDLKAIKSEFPPVTSDNLEKIVTMTKEYLTELHNSFPEEFEILTNHILDLQTSVLQKGETQAA